MSRFFACAGLGVFLTLAASGLAIFAHVGQINGSLVPRNIRMVDVDVSSLGSTLGVGTALYGSGPQRTANSGLRNHYEWGLWKYCEKASTGGSPDVCSGTKWANEFQPVPAILFDVPTQYQTQVANHLRSGTFTSDGYLGRFSKGAFYVLFIGAVAGGLALITGFLAHRIAFLLAAMLTFFAFLCEAVGCIIWTVIIEKTKSSISGTGINVSYGDGLWLYWASTGCLFLAALPSGRDRY
ncbi:MAG: hypothetical protein CYPHOPRED_003240 [Cyphobasidiales sp. Tagirdzhanova-0007]|nr:MAG: hypothetical protein CYPHOPRED_003240 [Cyphobasidiales sp. Tagirdzhanova-0007]